MMTIQGVIILSFRTGWRGSKRMARCGWRSRKGGGGAQDEESRTGKTKDPRAYGLGDVPLIRGPRSTLALPRATIGHRRAIPASHDALESTRICHQAIKLGAGPPCHRAKYHINTRIRSRLPGNSSDLRR